MITTVERTSITGGLERKKPVIQQNILLWSNLYPSRYVWRHQRTEPYRVLFGEILLEKTRHDVATTYERFLKFFPSLSDLTAASQDELKEALLSLHLEKYRWLFNKLVKGLANVGELPRDDEGIALISGLKHEGVKAMLCFGYGLPVGVVNKHVSRMLTRIFATELPASPPEGLIEALGESLAFFQNSQRYSEAMLEVSELICQSGIPRCQNCPVKSQCDFALGIKRSDPLIQTNA